MLVLIVWAVPIVLAISLGGFAIALVLSFPVHLFSCFVSRGVAIIRGLEVLDTKDFLHCRPPEIVFQLRPAGEDDRQRLIPLSQGDLNMVSCQG